MNEQRAVIQQMVDALDHADELLGNNDTLVMNGAAAGRWLLEQPAVQEPVAWLYKGDAEFDGKEWRDNIRVTTSKQVADWQGKDIQPLYTAPPAPQPVPVKTYHDGKPWPVAPKPWVGLTDAEVMQTMSGDWTSQFYFARAIEAKLKEKNT